MGSFSQSHSPVATMSPNPVHQRSFGRPMFPHHQPSPFGRLQSSTSAWSTPAMPAMPQKAGRKRSREEADVNLDVEQAKSETIQPAKQPEDQWVYGEGMMLIKSPSAYLVDAGSQSGTWVEEQATVEENHRSREARTVDGQLRPPLRSSKSQRLDLGAVPLSSAGTQPRKASPAYESSASFTTPNNENDSQPTVDQFTLHLGIGWRRLSYDEHIQAAARGWARYIENHYPISLVVIQLESKGLQSYLVQAAEGYFLFSEDLRHGQLVGRDLNQTFQNLKCSPPVFEGFEPMVATTTPQTITPEVDMDLC